VAYDSRAEDDGLKHKLIDIMYVCSSNNGFHEDLLSSLCKVNLNGAVVAEILSRDVVVFKQKKAGVTEGVQHCG
jgi:hypothetical protein